MKRFVFKLFIFFSPFILFATYIAYQILVLPIDHFTFRAWEALKVYENNNLLRGPFYPNSYLKKKELGDLSGRTKFPIIKEVEWFTDSNGYRKKEVKDRPIKIVVVGDSAIAGSALTQSDMYTEKLGNKLNVEVYPFAPSNFNHYLEDERFFKNPPDILIFESVEKLVLHIPEIIPLDKRVKKVTILDNILYKFKISNILLSKIYVYVDRFKKDPFMNYLYARIEEFPTRIMKGQIFNKKVVYDNNDVLAIDKTEMVFYSEPEEYFKDWQQNHIDRVIFTLKGYEEKLLLQKTKLVFMPIPNKENIYWEKVSGGKTNNNLKRLIEAAKANGIVTIDLLNPYQTIREKDSNRLLYHLDDTHWNQNGVKIAVEETLRTLKENNLINW